MPSHSMLIQYFGVGHTQIAWTLRQNPKIVFATLWNVTAEELLVSFDGMSFNIPPEYTNKGYFRPKYSKELVNTDLEEKGIQIISFFVYNPGSQRWMLIRMMLLY